MKYEREREEEIRDLPKQNEGEEEDDIFGNEEGDNDDEEVDKSNIWEEDGDDDGIYIERYETNRDEDEF